MNIIKVKFFLLGLPNTLIFNFYYFPLKVAIRLPVLLTHKVRLKKLKGSVLIQSEEIRRGMITIGYAHVSINDVNEYSLWNVEGTVVFKGRAGFGAGTKIAVGKDATLTFGNNFLITARSEIACFKEITFGDNDLLSWDILVMDTDAHPIYNNKNERINKDKPIKIGNHVWIGCRSIILKGTQIPDNCVIGVSTLVHRRFNETNSLIVGNPALIVKKDIVWGKKNQQIIDENLNG